MCQKHNVQAKLKHNILKYYICGAHRVKEYKQMKVIIN